jgi:catechol 2,3-dioxygenase-like lactoylglutathione lyase family enzyme
MPAAITPSGIQIQPFPVSVSRQRRYDGQPMDHIGLLVSDLSAAKTFYVACLSPLGWKFRDYGDRGGVFRAEGATPFYLTPAPLDTKGAHFAFRASARTQVDAFHRAAVSQGAADNGPPGLRPDYGNGYYAAFVLDANGNNLEAVHHESIES